MIKVSQLDMKGVLLKLISLVFSMATVKSQVHGNSTSACYWLIKMELALVLQLFMIPCMYSYTCTPVVGMAVAGRREVVCV